MMDKKPRFARYRDNFKGQIDEIVAIESSPVGLVATTLFTDPVQTYFPLEEQLLELSEQDQSKARARWAQLSTASEQGQSSPEQVQRSSETYRNSSAQPVDKTVNLFPLLARNARRHLPAKATLLDSMTELWPIVELLLDKDIYKNTQVDSFGNLVKQMESGVINYCPMPLYREIKDDIEKLDLHLVNRSRKSGKLPDRRKLVTKTIQQFIEYRRQYYPSKFWLKLNSALDGIDNLLTYIIRVA